MFSETQPVAAGDLLRVLGRPISHVYWGGQLHGCRCGQGGKCGQWSEDPVDIAMVVGRLRASGDVRQVVYDRPCDTCITLVLGTEYIEVCFLPQQQEVL